MDEAVALTLSLAPLHETFPLHALRGINGLDKHILMEVKSLPVHASTYSSDLLGILIEGLGYQHKKVPLAKTVSALCFNGDLV